MLRNMKFIKRFLLDKLTRAFKNNRIIIVVGSRQVGKTTLMEMYRRSGAVSIRQFYFNLEDIASLNICQNLDTLKGYLQDKGVDIAKNNVFLIIDEFQYIKNATKLFKIIYDLYPKVYILASGSSSIEIQKHLKESLAGRKKVYNLYTLSYEEFLRFKSEKEYRRFVRLDYYDISLPVIEMYNKYLLDEYLLFGGYPKVSLIAQKDDKIEELQDIFNSYIQKDIKALIKGEEISAYNNLIKILASQIGNLLNVHELANTLHLGRRQILKYLNVLRQTFVIELLNPYFSNKRTEISKMPKLYYYDNGIANFALGNFGDVTHRPNIGSIIENFVFNELIKYKPIQYQLYFWRTKMGTEIDFILEGNNELIPIEVKWQQSINKPTIPKSYFSFFAEHKNINRAVIITKDFCLKVRQNKKTIYFIPAVFFHKFVKKL